MEGCELEFTPEALKVIASKALERNTGARALRGVIEEMMLDIMYRLPEEGKGGKYVVTEEVARKEADLFDQRVRRKESA
jgi:ATP-dependent Clp protease ATP-binding subunit ClpX